MSRTCRSGPTGRRIVISEFRSDQTFLELLLLNVPRINALCLTGYSSVESIDRDLPGFFDSPIPNLVSLELQQSTAPQPFAPDGSLIPPILRNIQTLKSLCLTRTPITNLVEFQLIGYTSSFDFETFLGFLGSHPALESVDLDIKFIDDSVREIPGRKVPLARLRRLSITCFEAIDSKRLLSCIPLPRGISVEVHFNKQGDCPGFISLLPSQAY